jgi:predicted ribosomally synthesized peptide with SipW-like signal peptide
MSEQIITGPRLIIRWVHVTWGGWLLGIPFVIVFALIGELVRVGGAQFLVGAGMGAAVGLAQSFTIRKMIGKTLPWILASMIGLALPFVATDLAKVIGKDLPYALEMNVAIGGLLAGIWQSLLLKSVFAKTWPWIVGCTIGWALGGFSSAIADWLLQSHAVRGLPGAFAYLGIIAAGGLVLGLVTAGSLAVMSSSDSKDA